MVDSNVIVMLVYRGDGVTCTDINECGNTEQGRCDDNEVCSNTDGSYICSELYDLILSRKNREFFRNPLISNPDNPDANTFSIIGDLCEDDYRGADGKFQFKLVYTYNGVPRDVLIWKQSSWLLESNIDGYEPLQIPPEVRYRNNAGVSFRGLGYNFAYRQYSLSDGTGSEHSWFWNSIGEMHSWGGGTPGYDGKVAIAVQLYIINPSTALSTVEEVLTEDDRVDDDGFLMLLNRKQGYFFANPLSQNGDNPDAGVYSIIGDTDFSQYRDANNELTFKLVYGYASNVAPAPDTLIWKQTSLLTDRTITGYQGISIPQATRYATNQGVIFKGLGLNVAYAHYSLLDGNGASHTWFWCSVGEKTAWNGGTPGFDGKVAITETLYILDPSASAKSVPYDFDQYNIDNNDEWKINLTSTQLFCYWYFIINYFIG